ncbi:hypothetical protein BaRGS_00031866, partial [Batillaria attramentaria]
MTTCGLATSQLFTVTTVRSTLSLACGKCGWSQSNPEGRTTLFDDGLKKELAAVVDSLEKAENDSDRDRRSNRSAAKSGGRDRGQKRSSRQKSRRLAWPDPDDEDLPTFSQCQDDVGGQSDDAKSDHAEKGKTHNEDHSEEFTHTLHQMRLSQPQSSCRRFGCLECGITFASASHLIVHVRKKHSVKKIAENVSTEKAADTVPDKLSEKTDEKSDEKVGEKMSEKVTEKSGEKSTGTGSKAAKPAAAKRYQCPESPIPAQVPVPPVGMNAGPNIWGPMDPNLGPNGGVSTNYQGFPLMCATEVVVHVCAVLGLKDTCDVTLAKLEKQTIE